MLASLVVIAALFQFRLAARLLLFRRVLTPTVSRTVVMLIPVTIMPVIFDLLNDVPDGSPAAAAPLPALATLLVIGGIALKATGAWRLWAPITDVVAGSLVAGFYGLYDVDRVAEASWIGLPKSEWRGFDLDFGPTFWALLAAFLLVALIDTIRTVGGGVAIQRVSWRARPAVDFRAVQGAVTVDGIGKLLSGPAGTVPNSAYSTGTTVTELTGVVARGVRVAAGAAFIALAFFPKALAVVLAIPSPVVTAYLSVVAAMLFVLGMKIVVQDGIDYRKGLVVGIAFWVGVGFQSGLIFPEHVSEFVGGAFRNGMTAGGLVAILMTVFLELMKPRRSLIEAAFDLSVMSKIREFLGAFASRSGWDTEMADRLDAASEETLLTLIGQDEAGEEHHAGACAWLHTSIAYKEDGGAVIEFVVASR